MSSNALGAPGPSGRSVLKRGFPLLPVWQFRALLCTALRLAFSCRQDVGKLFCKGGSPALCSCTVACTLRPEAWLQKSCVEHALWATFICSTGCQVRGVCGRRPLVGWWSFKDTCKRDPLHPGSSKAQDKLSTFERLMQAWLGAG